MAGDEAAKDGDFAPFCSVEDFWPGLDESKVVLLEEVVAESVVGGRSDSEPVLSWLPEGGVEGTGTEGDGVPMALPIRPTLVIAAAKP